MGVYSLVSILCISTTWTVGILVETRFHIFYLVSSLPTASLDNPLISSAYAFT